MHLRTMSFIVFSQASVENASLQNLFRSNFALLKTAIMSFKTNLLFLPVIVVSQIASDCRSGLVLCGDHLFACFSLLCSFWSLVELLTCSIFAYRNLKPGHIPGQLACFRQRSWVLQRFSCIIAKGQTEIYLCGGRLCKRQYLILQVQTGSTITGYIVFIV